MFSISSLHPIALFAHGEGSRYLPSIVALKKQGVALKKQDKLLQEAQDKAVDELDYIRGQALGRAGLRSTIGNIVCAADSL